MQERIEISNDHDGQQSLISSFHRVQSLIPVNQELEAVPPEMRVSDALRIMEKGRFSQLPVVAGDAVLGLFSYRSFSNRAVTVQKTAKEPLGNLPVEDFLEDLEYVHPEEDWNRVNGYLNRDDAFFVGHRDGLEGMVTTMDLLDKYQEIAKPFTLIAEIEQSLRQIVRASINEADMQEAIYRSLKTAYPEGKIPDDLNEMTFDNFVQIISNGENWPRFEGMFGKKLETRKRTEERLRQIGGWRNVIFHFRRPLEEWEQETLSEYREWLHRRARAFEGRRREAKKSVLPESQQDEATREDYIRLLNRKTVPRGQKLLYRALYHAGDMGLSRDDLVDQMGTRDRSELAGILGALGTRCNYTPGYGKTYKPGLEMVVQRQQTMDGEKLYLASGMIEVLRELDPEWLK